MENKQAKGENEIKLKGAIQMIVGSFSLNQARRAKTTGGRLFLMNTMLTGKEKKVRKCCL